MKIIPLRKQSIVLCILPILVVTFAWGRNHVQNETGYSIEKIKEAYSQFLFTEVVTLAADALTHDPPPPEEERVEIHTYLAFAYIALGETEKAKESFEAALRLNPNLTLDPVYVSPKIIAIFNEVKSTIETLKESKEEEPLQPAHPIPKEDKRFGGAWRSLVLPGWGQLYKGQKRKAMIIFGIQTITISTSLYAHFRMEEAHDEYIRTQDPELIESKYDRYNSFYKLRNYFLLCTAATWLYSHIDAAVSQPSSEGEGDTMKKNILWIPTVREDSFSLCCTIHF